MKMLSDYLNYDRYQKGYEQFERKKIIIANMRFL